VVDFVLVEVWAVMRNGVGRWRRSNVRTLNRVSRLRTENIWLARVANTKLGCVFDNAV
jgi:hypothetical protein